MKKYITPTADMTAMSSEANVMLTVSGEVTGAVGTNNQSWNDSWTEEEGAE